MTKSEIQSQALKLLKDEYTRYKDGYCWVTRNKAINMRYIWDLIREHYYGIFVKEKDRLGQYKIPYPLTESAVWENIKNIDVDTKDINVRATSAHSSKKSMAVRYTIKDWMRKHDFGETINHWLMDYVFVGHLIVKKIKVGTDIEIKSIDLRNCYFDYQCDSINKTAFMERSVQDVNDIRANNPDWINLKEIGEEYNLAKVDGEQKMADSSSPECEIFERWGKIPLSWITGKTKDAGVWKEGIIHASGLNGKGLIHKIQLNNGIRPYEEVAFEDAPNRKVGRGVAEKLLFLQIYLNTLYNIRRNNNLKMMNQLFKFRENAGITPDKLSLLVAGGAIGVQDMGDIERIDTTNINFGDSLNEEQNLVAVANRVTSTQEPASGEQMPSSMPATNAILQSQSVKTAHQLRQERFGLFLSRLFKNQVSPDLKGYYKGKEIRVEKDDKFEALKRIKVNSELNKRAEAGGMMDIESEKQAIEKEINEAEDFFIKIEDGLDFKEYEIEFFVTDESLDKNTVLQSLQQILFNYPKITPDEGSRKILAEIYDLLGIDGNSLLSTQMAGQMGGQMGQPGQMPQQQEGEETPSQLVTSQANRVAGLEQAV
jgi:hypothetical protein